VLDAPVADRVAVAIEERHREVGFLQPVVVGGLAKCRHGQRQHQDQAAEPDGGGFGQWFNEDPAFPAPDMEAVHEGRESLIKFARALGGREQRRVDARIEIQHPVPDFSLPLRWYDLAHECPFSEVRNTFERPLYELRKTKGTSKSQIPVPLFRFEVPGRACRLPCRNFKSAALGPLVSSSTRPGAVETSCGNVAANPRRCCVVGDLVTF